MTCLAVAACNKQCVVGRLEIKGAFIQTEMSGTAANIKCTGRLKDTILLLYPEIKKYIGIDDILYCKILKLLYRWVQASKLWYLKLEAFLEWKGY